MIEKAFLFAYRAHGEQKRKDGKPYIVHPVEVAMELARNGASEELICAGFLHDTIEDASITRQQLEEAFTPYVAELVAEDSEDKEKAGRSVSWRRWMTCAGAAGIIKCLCAPISWQTCAVSIQDLPRRARRCGTVSNAAERSRHGCFSRRWKRCRHWQECLCMRN